MNKLNTLAFAIMLATMGNIAFANEPDVILFVPSPGPTGPTANTPITYYYVDNNPSNDATSFIELAADGVTTIKTGTYDYKATPPTLTIKNTITGETEVGQLTQTKTEMIGSSLETWYNPRFAGKTTVYAADGVTVIATKNYDLTSNPQTVTITYPAGSPKANQKVVQALDPNTGLPQLSTTYNKQDQILATTKYAYNQTNGGVKNYVTTFVNPVNNKTSKVEDFSYAMNGSLQTNTITYYKPDGSTATGIVTTQQFTNGYVTSQSTTRNGVQISSTTFQNDNSGTPVTSTVTLYKADGTTQSGITINRTYSNGTLVSGTEMQGKVQVGTITYKQNSDGTYSSHSLTNSATNINDITGTVDQTLSANLQLVSQTNSNTAGQTMSVQQYSNEELTSQTNYNPATGLKTSDQQFSSGVKTSQTNYNPQGQKISVQTLTNGKVTTQQNFENNVLVSTMSNFVYTASGAYSATTTPVGASATTSNYTPQGVVIPPPAAVNQTVTITKAPPKTTVTTNPAFSTTARGDNVPTTSPTQSAFSN